MIIQSEEICRLSCMRQAVFFNLSPVFVDAPIDDLAVLTLISPGKTDNIIDSD